MFLRGLVRVNVWTCYGLYPLTAASFIWPGDVTSWPTCWIITFCSAISTDELCCERPNCDRWRSHLHLDVAGAAGCPSDIVLRCHAMVTTVELQRRCIHCRHLEAVNHSSVFREAIQTFKSAPLHKAWDTHRFADPIYLMGSLWHTWMAEQCNIIISVNILQRHPLSSCGFFCSFVYFYMTKS